MSEVAQDAWQDALTRRLRTLVRLSPIHRIEATKALRDLPLETVDMRALALRALDLAIERMGLGGGMTHDELRDELAPLVARMAPHLDAEGRLAIAAAMPPPSCGSQVGGGKLVGSSATRSGWAGS